MATKDTKQIILDSALNLFSQKGFKGATMRDIAEQANISLGLTYSYFNNKEELLKEILAQFLLGRKQLFQRILTLTELEQTSSIKILKTMIEDIKQNKEQFRLYAQLMLNPQTSKELITIKQKLIKFHQEEKLFVEKINKQQQGNPMIPAELFKVVITGMMFLYLHRDDFDINESIQLLDKVFNRNNSS